MGCWSVYCSISQIAITAGNDMVLLPLKPNHSEISYLPWLPATLPIFGKYDDYGGLEDIVEDENTKLIEKYFGLSILDFTKIFTDYIIYDRSESKHIVKKLKHNAKWDEIKDWNFLFIDKKVYDFMSSHADSYSIGHLEFGDPGILKLLGATYKGENLKNLTSDPKRYKHEWEFQGKLLYADNHYAHYGTESIFHVKGRWSSLEKCGFEITPELEKLSKKTNWQLWEHFSEKKQKEMLGWIIGKDRHNYDFDEDLEYLIEKFAKKVDPEKVAEIKQEREKNEKLVDKYYNNIPIFGNRLSELVSIRNNMHCMSGAFKPFIKFLTPQCGEKKDHQVILKKFAEINKSYIEDEE